MFNGHRVLVLVQNNFTRVFDKLRGIYLPPQRQLQFLSTSVFSYNIAVFPRSLRLSECNPLPASQRFCGTCSAAQVPPRLQRPEGRSSCG
jgi:hypothetical protein